jgi:hypothetical protein
MCNVLRTRLLKKPKIKQNAEDRITGPTWRKTEVIRELTKISIGALYGAPRL